MEHEHHQEHHHNGHHEGHAAAPAAPHVAGHRAASSGHAGHAGHSDHGAMVADFRRRFWVSLALTPPVLLLSPMIRHFLGLDALLSFPGSEIVVFALSTIVFFYGGWPFLTGFVAELRDRKPGMMTLIALAISVAYVYSAAVTFGVEGMSFYWELVTLIVIMLLGHWLEMRSVMGASRALEELVRLLPDTAARIGADGAVEDVPISALLPGDRVLIRPGSKVPVDGTIVEGKSSFNEAMLTGESRPVSKEPGASAIGGAINGAGAVTIEVTATGDKTYLAQVINLVREAQGTRSRTQDIANRAAGWLTYIAIGVGVGTLVVWLALGESAQFAIERMVTVMVIACPHALGLAVPLVVAVSTSLSAGSGLLIRDRAAFERARNLDAVVFDKTGTLTEGRFGVSDIVLLAGGSENEELRFAASAESQSEHPIAHGIVAAAKERGIDLPRPSGVRNVTGEGIVAEVEGQDVSIVSPGHLARTGKPIAAAELAQLESQGKTVVVLVRDGTPRALFALADIVRAESRQAIAELKGLGISSDHADRRRQGVSPKLGLEVISGSANFSPRCFPTRSRRRSRSCSRAACRSPWSATASTTRRRWSRPTSASRSAPARTSRSNPPTWCWCSSDPARCRRHPRPLARHLPQDGAEPDLGHRVQCHRDTDGSGHHVRNGVPDDPGGRRGVHVVEHDHRGDKRAAAEALPQEGVIPDYVDPL
jgi:Cu2+-exporting ATPase